MTDFEGVLRTRLAEAAGQAPRFTGFDPQRETTSQGPSRGTGRLHRPGPWLAAAATVAVIAAGASWWSLGDRDQPEATCAAELVLDGRRYLGHGGLLRVPRPGASLGTATSPACKDGEGPGGGGRTEAFRLPGSSPDVAILADGTVWLSEDTGSLPGALRELTAPVTCSETGEWQVAGTVTGIEGPPVERDYQPTTPYTATFVADEGSALPLDDSSSVTISVRVTAATTGGRDPALLRTALADGARIMATVRCDGPLFEALSLRVAP